MHLCELPYATDAYNFFPLILLWDERSDLCWRVKFPCHFLKATLIRTYVCITFGEKKYKNCNNKANYLLCTLFLAKKELHRYHPVLIGCKKNAPNINKCGSVEFQREACLRTRGRVLCTRVIIYSYRVSYISYK